MAERTTHPLVLGMGVNRGVGHDQYLPIRKSMEAGKQSI